MLPFALTKIIRPLHTSFKNVSNHYEILGVSRTATVSEIKSKYYELAKIYHPDVCKDNDSHSKFNKISIAYEILTNESKRKQYDYDNPYYGESNIKGNSHAQNKFDGFSARNRSHKQRQAKGQNDEDPFMSYDEYFKKNRAYAKPKRGSDANANITITLEESLLGVRKQVMYSQQQLCQSCATQEKQICFTCGGKKTIFNRVKREKQECHSCEGKGYKNQCEKCNGKSFVMRDVTQSIYINKNTHHKTILRMQGLGHHGFKSNNGDLYVTVLVQQSPYFKIDGNNIFSEHQLDYVTATLGGRIKIRTIYGEKQIQIEPGTQSGKQLRIFNLGLTSQYSKRKGDHIVTFKIKVPNSLTEKQRQLLASLNL